MPTPKQDSPVHALVSAFGAAKWTEAQAKTTVKNLKTFATELLRGKLDGMTLRLPIRRLRANFACLKVEVKEVSADEWNDVRKVVHWLRKTAKDLSSKKYRAQMASRYRARLFR